MNIEEEIHLTDSEYFYLSDKFEILRADETDKIRAYVVSSRRECIRRIAAEAFRNELTKEEQAAARLHFMEGMSVTAVAEALGMTRKTVYKRLDSAKQKLFLCLKYAVMCDFSLLHPPTRLAEIFKEEACLKKKSS